MAQALKLSWEKRPLRQQYRGRTHQGRFGHLVTMMTEPKQDSKDLKIAELNRKLEELGGKLTDERFRAAALERELELSRKGEADARRQMADLSALLASVRERLAVGNNLPTLELPEAAKQLRECVLIFSPRGERIEALIGDVVVTGTTQDAEKLQKKLGGKTKVRLINSESWDSLLKAGYIR